MLARIAVTAAILIAVALVLAILPSPKAEDASAGGPTFVGDVNCDGTANSIDAALILQFDAGLIPSLACIQDADVNEDGFINAIDAALLIQFCVCPLESLPPWEPTPAGLSGDVDCNGTVDAVDATLILQFDARLISRLRCQENADVNGDGAINSIDAVLIASLIISEDEGRASDRDTCLSLGSPA
ncbi:MAG: dockerin type I repeat-containing protein [Chloroflexi bacterium]|nr:dockerin type I repeat-containing protein [Chloroflexota bacterium]